MRNLKLTVRFKILGTCTGASMTVRSFSQLFNVHGVKDVGQAEIHTAEPLVPEPRATEVELAIDKLKVTNRQVLIKYRQN